MLKTAVAVIPARSGSKSILDKNIRLLGGHPLIAYSIILAKLSSEIDRILVSTDSEKYAGIAMKYGAEVPLLRPKELSEDNSTDYEFFRHILDFMKENKEEAPDLFVHLRPTTPLRDVREIDCAIKYMKNNKYASALRSANKTHLTPYKMFKKKGEYMEPFLSHNETEFYNLPRQQFEDTYIPNGVVDIVRPSIIESTGLLHGNNIKLWETTKYPDIDVMEDFYYAESCLHNPKFKIILSHLNETKCA